VILLHHHHVKILVHINANLDVSSVVIKLAAVHIARCRSQTRTRQSSSCHLIDEANGPRSNEFSVLVAVTLAGCQALQVQQQEACHMASCSTSLIYFMSTY
jgi:hypothetical protein